MREQYDWAEANSDEARKISEAGTEYVRKRAEPEVMKQSYERYFVHSLKAVLDAYMPLSDRAEAKIEMDEWLAKWTMVGKCSGRDGKCSLKSSRVEE